MRPGTPGFIGERLRAAREARGISAASLADLIGVSRAAITQYEKGVQTPAPRVMDGIASTLNLPLQHFLRPISETEPGVVFYRSLSSATKSARSRAERRYMWLREIVAYLREYVKFPKENLPDLGVSDGKPHQIDLEHIDELATETRRAWGIGDGPIPNLAALLEKNGVVVARHDLDSNKLDAFSEWNRQDKTPYVILNSEKASAVRSRYDAGHELAHLLLHRGVTQATLNTRSMFSLMEDQANRFSGAFLLPESTFTKDLHSLSLDSLRVLKPKWRVSVGAMLKRVAHLGLISESEERRLWINYGRRGWRRREPLDDQLAEEQPRYVRRCIELLIEKNVVPREELPFRLALPAQDIERLVGLPSDFFSPPEPEIALTRETERDVLPFPVPESKKRRPIERTDDRAP